MSDEISVLCDMANSVGMQKCISGCDLLPPRRQATAGNMSAFTGHITKDIIITFIIHMGH